MTLDHVPSFWLSLAPGPRRAALADGLRRLGAPVVDRPHAGFDLALAEAGPPGPDAVRACAIHRAAHGDMPLIVIAAFAAEADRVLALESGADDCVGPECSPRELLARARAVLRRVRRSRETVPAEPMPSEPVTVGAWAYCPLSRSLRRGDEQRTLSAVEYGLLAALTEQPGRTLARAQILARWQPQPDAVALRAVDTAVMRLRRVIETDPARPRLIRTVRGRGYCFVPDR